MFTDAQLLDLEIPQQFRTYRFDLLDVSLQKIGEVQPVETCSITNDSGRKIRRTLEGFKLDPGTTPDIDTFSARVRPMLVLQNGSEFPLGVFLYSDATQRRYTTGLVSDGSLGDLGLTVDQPRGNILSWPAGYNIRDAILSLAIECGITTLQMPPLLALLGSAVSWPSGTTPWTVMNDLAPLAECMPPYFDNSGTLTFDPVPDFGQLSPAVTYEADKNIYRGTIQESDDRQKAPNRYVAVASQVTGTPIVGTFTIPAAAPNSFENIGYYRKRTIHLQGVGSVASCQAVARRAYFVDRWAYKHVTFAGPPDPRHDTNTVVEFLGDTYREASWRLTLTGGGAMEHRLQQVYAA